METSVTKSESIKEIGKALVQFNMKVAKIPKTDSNPFFKSKYAALPSILDAIQIPLEESGLAVTQHPDGEYLTTLIIHFESGEFIQSSYRMSPIKSDPQSMGSAITYARRYAIGAILRLNIDEDDDGNKASTPQPTQYIAPSTQPSNDLPWLNLFDKEGNIKEGRKNGIIDLFSEGKTLDDLKLKVKINKKETDYILNHILNQK